ncbi:MAG: ATP-binding protein [Planctomycetota bacterium]
MHDGPASSAPTSPATPAPPAAASPDATLRGEVDRLKAELHAARQMASLGELASTTTHEFNNALTTILNYAKMGLRHTDDATRTRALEKILSAGQRAATITNSVLGMARNRSQNPAPTNLGALVSEAVVLLEREMHKHRVQVETAIDPAPRAWAVAGQIQQVLINLLTNARQAMPQGGRVAIRLREDPATGTVDLTVQDNGPGIPPEALPKIFQPGYSTKAGPDATGKGGAGVGLAACREIIEEHGGKIRVESAVGRGAAFTLKLPIAAAAKTQAAGAAPVKLGVPTTPAAKTA